MKRCFKCGQFKDRYEFYKHSKMADGLLGKCKECTKKDSIENRKNNNIYYKEYEKKRSKLPHRKKLSKEYSMTEKGRNSHNLSTKKWIAKNPEKRKAQNILSNAIRDGIVLVGKCVVCGSEEHVHGHHHDYEMPIDVVWLCPIHHKEEHRRIDRNKNQ